MNITSTSTDRAPVVYSAISCFKPRTVTGYIRAESLIVFPSSQSLNTVSSNVVFKLLNRQNGDCGCDTEKYRRSKNK